MVTTSVVNHHEPRSPELRAALLAFGPASATRPANLDAAGLAGLVHGHGVFSVLLGHWNEVELMIDGLYESMADG